MTMESVKGAVPVARPSSLADIGITMGFVPWRRFFARTLDNAVNPGLVFLGILGGLHLIPDEVINETAPWLPSALLVLGLSWLVVAGIVNAALISTTGSTLGKLIFGIQVRELDGRRLSFGRALHREFLIWMSAFTFGIPLLNLIALAIAYGYLEENRQTWWDRRMQLHVTYQPTTTARKLLWAATILAMMFAPMFYTTIFANS